VVDFKRIFGHGGKFLPAREDIEVLQNAAVYGVFNREHGGVGLAREHFVDRIEKGAAQNKRSSAAHIACGDMRIAPFGAQTAHFFYHAVPPFSARAKKHWLRDMCGAI